MDKKKEIKDKEKEQEIKVFDPDETIEINFNILEEVIKMYK